MAAAVQKCLDAVPRKADTAWVNLAITISQLEAEGGTHPGRMIELVLDAGYEDYLKETFTNYRSRFEDLQQLAVFAGNFPTLEEFLTQLSLMTNIEAEGDRPAGQDTERVRLSTIHQAKGLEFDVVFVIMLCDGLFPSTRSMDDPADLEEERRLFYVAVTRARNELYLSYPRVRVMPGSTDYAQLPSRFLRDFPPELIEEWTLKARF
jgi:DNA helicase-2/ATP-dependent DNA helicase PcrA